MYHYNDKPLDILGILTHSLQLAKTSLAKVYIWFFLYIGLCQSLSYLNNNQAATANVVATHGAAGYLIIIASILFMILTPLFISYAYSSVNAIASTGNPATTSSAPKIHYWRVLGAVILFNILPGMAALPAILVIYILLAFSPTLAVALGIMAVFVPFVVMIYLIFWIPTIVIGDLPLTPALKASYRLVHKNWWHTAIAFFVPSIYLIAIYLIMLMINSLLAFILGLLIYPLIALYFIALNLVLFNDLTIRHNSVAKIS